MPYFFQISFFFLCFPRSTFFPPRGGGGGGFDRFLYFSLWEGISDDAILGKEDLKREISTNSRKGKDKRQKTILKVNLYQRC
jgi:hypothetical protein